MAEDGPSPETIRLIHSEVQAQLDNQFSQIDSLNSRAQQILGFAAGILALTVALRPPTDSHRATALYLLGALPFVALVWCGHKAWEILPWRRDPAPGALWNRCKDYPDDHVRTQLLLNLAESYDQNGTTIKDKARYLKYAQRLLAVEVISLMLVASLLPYVK
jgi:hypothetical protein